MKSYVFTLILSMLLVACAENKKSKTSATKDDMITTSEKSPLEGNWEMVGFYNYRNNEIVDSFKANEGYRQIKMFNEGKVMWSKLVPSDSIEWFGYGSYKATDTTLTEVMEFGSKVMNTVIAEEKEFSYKLDLSKDKFSQIRVDEDGYKIYSENYKRID